VKRPAALLLLLSACGDSSAHRGEDKIDCAVDGATGFARVCTMERSSGPEFTVRSPSGSFRRLARVDDGRGVVAADGAEQAMVKVIGKSLIEVSIGGDRYRLPATVR
jgi:hypothetical protein